MLTWLSVTVLVVVLVDVEGELALSRCHKSNHTNGGPLRSAPMMPKEGLGVSGAASCRTYHHVLIFPNNAQPVCFQYVLAFWMEATAWFSCGPETGHPVSVTQNGLLSAAATVVS